jgi:RNA-binding protein
VETPPKTGERVVDEKLKPVGIVFDVFGPVSSPYVAVKTEVKDAKMLVNHTLYVVSSSKPVRKGKEKRK